MSFSGQAVVPCHSKFASLMRSIHGKQALAIQEVKHVYALMTCVSEAQAFAGKHPDNAPDVEPD